MLKIRVISEHYMINESAKLNKKVLKKNIEKKSIQDLQDEVFRKMFFEKKMSILDSFFKLGKELQSLNDRKKI